LCHLPPISSSCLIIKRLVKLGLGFGSFHTARRTLKGYEAMAMIRKGQIQNVDRGNMTGPISFIHQIFGIAA
jgi:IS6 family transposase